MALVEFYLVGEVAIIAKADKRKSE